MSSNDAEPSPKPIPDRITVAGYVFHQRSGKEPTSIRASFTRFVENQDKNTTQLYERSLEVGEEWEKLDFGWLNGGKVGIFVVQNHAGAHPQENPTLEEAENDAKKVIEIAYGPTDTLSWQVPPGETFFGTPKDADSLYIRSLSNDTEYTLYALPK